MGAQKFGAYANVLVTEAIDNRTKLL